MGGSWGTQAQPKLMSAAGWFDMHPFLRVRARHVHVLHHGLGTETCVHNKFGGKCL
jgi:hypothetical protein